MGTVERWSPEWHRRLNQVIVGLPEKTPEERREIRTALARHDVVAFARIYLERHVTGKETGELVTFAECHYEWALQAESWAVPVTEPMQHRDAYVAPRSTGKSTWWFLIIPLWAAAFGHVRFCASFAQAAGQAEGHLQTMRSELDTNPLLKSDFPDLCAPARRQSSGTTVADRQSMIHTASGFTFSARGLDSAVLGLKVGEARPDCLIIDDAEPDESSYSPYLASKRLRTVTDAIFALNIYARVIMTGTVTMAGSIIHQMVRYAAGDRDDTNQWVADENIRVHHHKAILTNDDGTERSIWPQKWPLSWLQSRRHTREYAKNYDNDPKAVSGDFWAADDFRYGTLGDLATRWILEIDPAVTTKGTSDWTGLSVIAYRPPTAPGRDSAGRPTWEHPVGLPEWMDPSEGQCEVVYSTQVKLAGEKLRGEVLRILGEFQRCKYVRVETNQGGETWETVLHDLPVKMLMHHTKVGKEAKFAQALTRYHEKRVIHRERFTNLEGQMTAFPRVPHDDEADSVVNGLLYFLREPSKVRAGARAIAYT